MNERHLDDDEVLRGYDMVSALYPYVPSLSHWRAWEYAAYRHHGLDGGRILDLGCGDGRYFKLVWPDAGDVVGVDADPAVVEIARHAKIYGQVHLAPAHRIPEPDSSFDHVFANCCLEHMDHLDDVLAEVNRCLHPGGSLLCSVVTNRFIEWNVLPTMVGLAGFDEAAATLQREYLDYHHLANGLPVDGWISAFERAGLVVEEHIPILPRINSATFLLMDSLWHVKRKSGGELGDVIHPTLAQNARFPAGFRKVLAGLLEMESDPSDCSGAVFAVRKPKQ